LYLRNIALISIHHISTLLPQYLTFIKIVHKLHHKLLEHTETLHEKARFLRNRIYREKIKVQLHLK